MPLSPAAALGGASPAPADAACTPAFQLRRQAHGSPAGCEPTPGSACASSGSLPSAAPGSCPPALLDLSPVEQAPSTGDSLATLLARTPLTTPQGRAPATPAPVPTALLPRRARLMRMGLTGRDTSRASPPKAERARQLDDDDDDVTLRVLVAAALSALLLLLAGAAYFWRGAALHAAVGGKGTAVAVYRASAPAPSAVCCSVLFLPRSAEPGVWLAPVAAVPGAGHAKQSSTALMAPLPALAAFQHQPGALALATFAAASTAVALAASACGSAAQLAATAFAADGPLPAHKLAALTACLLLVAAFRLTGCSGARIASSTPARARRLSDLTTPLSGIGEYTGVASFYEEAESTGDDDASQESDGALVHTPEVTRLLSFSCAASPAGSLHTTVGYGSAFRVR